MLGWRRTVPPPVVPPQETPGILEAKERHARARQGFLDAVETGEQTRGVVDRMSRLLRDNHFGPLIERTMRS